MASFPVSWAKKSASCSQSPDCHRSAVLSAYTIHGHTGLWRTFRYIAAFMAFFFRGRLSVTSLTPSMGELTLNSSSGPNQHGIRSGLAIENIAPSRSPELASPPAAEALIRS